MKIREIIDIIEKAVPSEIQEEWDNSGIQIFASEGNIRRILVAMEINNDVVIEAQSLNAGLIVTHHPLIFRALSSVSIRNVTGQYIVDLIKSGISVYSTHTPFDKVEGGNNDWLAAKLGLSNITSFISGDGNQMIGRVGDFLCEITLGELADSISRKLSVPVEQLRTVGEKSELIRRVGICTGSGADLADLALENACDLLITGDVKYHDAQNAKSKGLCLIDAGHYGTEKSFAENFSKLMRRELLRLNYNEVEVIESAVDLNPFSG